MSQMETGLAGVQRKRCSRRQKAAGSAGGSSNGNEQEEEGIQKVLILAQIFSILFNKNNIRISKKYSNKFCSFEVFILIL